jgi:hypothetical protein
VADDAVLNNVLEKEYFTVRKANIGFVNWINRYLLCFFLFFGGLVCVGMLASPPFIIRGMEG